MLRWYNLGLTVLRPIGAALAWWQSRDPARAVEWAERRARAVPRVRPGGWWIHGASLGEARLVAALVHETRRRFSGLPLIVTAVSRTGRAALPSPPVVDHAGYAPLDFRGFPGRVLDAARPDGLVLVETEMWPNLVIEAAQRGVRIAIVNGRLAPERMDRYRRSAALFREVLDRVAAVGAQSEGDADRFRELGLDPSRLAVTGNLKYDLDVEPLSPEALRARTGPDRSPVVVAGSTGAGEDAPVLDAYAALRERCPRAVLVLAPRHLERVPEALAEARSRGLSTRRWTETPDPRVIPPDVVVLDATGVLASVYALADLAFVGGSLVPVGGHNVLEPASAGVPVLFGPHTGHVEAPAALLLDHGAAVRVASADELARAWIELADDPVRRRDMGQAGRDAVRRHRGATARSVDLLATTFAPGPGP